MTDHTPGPWHLGNLPPTNWRYILAPDSSEIAAVADWQENGDLHMEFGPDACANANLIASAPDMFAAIQTTFKWLSLYSRHPDSCKRVRNRIIPQNPRSGLCKDYGGRYATEEELAKIACTCGLDDVLKALCQAAN